MEHLLPVLDLTALGSGCNPLVAALCFVAALRRPHVALGPPHRWRRRNEAWWWPLGAAMEHGAHGGGAALKLHLGWLFGSLTAAMKHHQWRQVLRRRVAAPVLALPMWWWAAVLNRGGDRRGALSLQ